MGDREGSVLVGSYRKDVVVMGRPCRPHRLGPIGESDISPWTDAWWRKKVRALAGPSEPTHQHLNRGHRGLGKGGWGDMFQEGWRA